MLGIYRLSVKAQLEKTREQIRELVKKANALEEELREVDAEIERTQHTLEEPGVSYEIEVRPPGQRQSWRVEVTNVLRQKGQLPMKDIVSQLCFKLSHIDKQVVYRSVSATLTSQRGKQFFASAVNEDNMTVYSIKKLEDRAEEVE